MFYVFVADNTIVIKELVLEGKLIKANGNYGSGRFDLFYKCLSAYCLQARPMFKDRRNFSKMVDPLLQGQYPVRGLYQALAIAAMCVQEQPNMRPAISDVVMALNYLASLKYDPSNPVQSSRRSMASSTVNRNDDKRPVAEHELKIN